MNNYSDLKDIDTNLTVCVELELINQPEMCVRIGKTSVQGILKEQSEFTTEMCLLDPFNIEIELTNKNYTLNHSTGILIKQIQIDGISMVPRFNHLAQYTNDHNNTKSTNHLEFNGTWILKIDCPFYQWLHTNTGQGWLIG
jgi:hypothetical protein